MNSVPQFGLVLPMLPHDNFQVLHLGQDYRRSDVSFSGQSVRRHVISCGFNFDHLVKVVPARFLCCKVTVFLFVVCKYLVGRYFKSM